MPRGSATTVRRASSIISMSTMPPPTDEPPPLRRSATFPPEVAAEIQRAADQGIYDIRGFGAPRKLPSFDDLVLLGASISRYPLQGYRGRRAPNVTLRARAARK